MYKYQTYPYHRHPNGNFHILGADIWTEDTSDGLLCVCSKLLLVESQLPSYFPVRVVSPSCVLLAKLIGTGETDECLATPIIHGPTRFGYCSTFLCCSLRLHNIAGYKYIQLN
jgi:hypothetical protein